MEAFTIRDAQRLSHAYILSSPDRAACLNLAGQIAAAAVCERGTDAPCGRCRGCRKARSGVHPDIIHVRREEGRQFLSVDQIRAMTADAYVLPNEAARKVYILDEADKMKTPEAQNAALKTLEEPPAGVIFLLCAENAGALLPTVRSRCVELSTNRDRERAGAGVSAPRGAGRSGGALRLVPEKRPHGPGGHGGLPRERGGAARGAPHRTARGAADRTRAALGAAGADRALRRVPAGERQLQTDIWPARGGQHRGGRKQRIEHCLK